MMEYLEGTVIGSDNVKLAAVLLHLTSCIYYGPVQVRPRMPSHANRYFSRQSLPCILYGVK